MLSLLHIENIAVIEQADIAFGSGLNLLTGETGAGKSIVIDALGAVIGLRTSRELVRTGAQTARVSAVFYKPPDQAYRFLFDNGIDLSGEEEVLIQRDISADGRNVCRVAGRPATVALLRQLGEYLLQIHGQHDSHSLLADDSHGPLLDKFAGLEADGAQYREAFALWRTLVHRLNELHMDESEKARQIDHLQFVCREIDEAELEDGEEETLLTRRQVLQNAGRLTEAVETAHAMLAGDDEFDGACSQLSQAVQALAGVSHLHADLNILHERLQELAYSSGDTAADLDAMRDAFDASPGELGELESRLDLIYRLKRKYGATVGEILAHGEACRAELDKLTFSEQAFTKLEAECGAAYEKAAALARSLHESRLSAASRLSGRVRHELEGLDMGKVSFEVELTLREGEHALRDNGLDDIRFLLSANLGEPLKPLSRIASGGELSRIMLSLKNVLAEGDEVGTLVFDEIDTGVSGRAAGRVAEKLAALSRGRQVLCVTHLPQIAAMADTHFHIVKEVAGDRTVTAVAELDRAGRVDELARIIGGLNITEITRSTAAEQLEAAAAYKEGIKTQ